MDRLDCRRWPCLLRRCRLRSIACLATAAALPAAALGGAVSLPDGRVARDMVLRLRTVASAGGAALARRTVSRARRVFEPGDALEYDVFLHSRRAGLGGVDAATTDGARFGDLSADAWRDQDGTAGHPSADLRQQAYGRWYHRRLPVPQAMVGRCSDRWELVDGGTGRAPFEVAAAMYDAIRITNGGQTALWVYRAGMKPPGQAEGAERDGATSAQLLLGPVHAPRPQNLVHFFVWHDFPDNIAVYVPRFPYHPHGLVRGQPWSGYGAGIGKSPPAGYYSSLNTCWYEQELQDMKRAGFDTALICSWGECPVNPWFRTSLLRKHMVPALDRSGVDVKIAMLDASYSQAAEWNYDRAGRFRPAYTAYTPEDPANLANPDPEVRRASEWEDDRDPDLHVRHRSPAVRWNPSARTGVPEPEYSACRAAQGDTRRYRHRYVYDFAGMDLADRRTWAYYYDRKIRPFFRSIPQRHWATHNGLPLEQGGRPLIVTYWAGWCDRPSVLAHGRALWEWVKERFARDFRDAHGKAVCPFIIHGHGWYGDLRPSGPLVDSASDAVSFWGSALTGPSIGELHGYRCCEIGPGFDSRLEQKANGGVGDVKDRRFGEQLTRWFDERTNGSYPWECDAVLFETWNELWEGTAIQRATDYPAPGGDRLPETYYMDTWRSLVETTSGLREYDATFLRTWSLPQRLRRGAIPLTVTVRNDGLMPWEAGAVQLVASLEDARSGRPVTGSKRRWPLPSTLLKGEEAAITWEAPADWPRGRFALRFDMVLGETTRFSALGDVPPKVMVRLE